MKNEQLLEQYKLYVEMADRISERRVQTSKFYMTLLSGLLVIVSFVQNRDRMDSFANHQFLIFLTIGVLGILVCFIWFVNVRSYRQLNTAKFQIIHQMEENLGFSPYKKEWEILGEGPFSRRYLQLTKIESLVPIILIIPYGIILTYSIINLW